MCERCVLPVASIASGRGVTLDRPLSGAADAQLRSDAESNWLSTAVLGHWRLPPLPSQLPSEIPFGNYAADAAVRRGADDWWVWHLAAPSVRLMGDCKMAHGKVTAPARRSRSAPVVAFQSIKGNVALPLSIVRAEEPV